MRAGSKIYRKSRQKYPGVTLLELLLVTLVVAILAALGVMHYGASPGERTRSKEVIANLKLIAAAEKIYRMETESYYASTGATPQEHIQNINKYLKLSLSISSSRNWDYSVTADADDFTAYGDRVESAPSPYNTCQYSIDDNLDEPKPVGGNCP